MSWLGTILGRSTPIDWNAKLFSAVDAKNILDIQKALENGADVNALSSLSGQLHKMTPLYVAASAGDNNIVAYLIGAGADVNKESANGATPLYIAAENGRTDAVATLLSVAAIDVNKPVNLHHTTPLHTAVREGYLEIVTALLARGANVHAATDRGERPIHVAVEVNSPALISLLVAHGADVNAVHGRNDHTPLIASLLLESRDAFHALLAIPEIDINKAAKNGLTPLYFAVSHGKLDEVKALLAMPGIDVNKAAPLHIAAYSNGDADTDVDREIVMLLLKAGANVEQFIAYKGKTIKQLAEDGEYAPGINELIAAPAMFSGFTQDDVAKLDTIFDTEIPAGGGRAPAENWSLCPVCLGYTERGGGCKYMTHDCREQPWFHAPLYERYKDDFGRISWCTVCGRICDGHHHYQLQPFDTVTPVRADIPPVTDMAVFFQSDCRPEGGGGLDEKLLRFRRFKEVARELNREVGEITQKNAMNELVKQVWNAPFSELRPKRMKEMRNTKAFNILTSNFAPPPPPTPLPTAAAAAEELLDFRRPSATELVAVAFPAGTPLAAGAASAAATNVAENAVGFADSGDVIYFRHVQLDGVLRDHFARREGVGQAALISAVEEGLKAFGVDKNFGKCLWHGSECGALLFPDEIKPFVPPELFEKYFVAFNRVYARRKKMGLDGYTLEGVPVTSGAASAAGAATGGAVAATGGAGTGMAGGFSKHKSKSKRSKTTQKAKRLRR